MELAWASPRAGMEPFGKVTLGQDVRTCVLSFLETLKQEALVWQKVQGQTLKTNIKSYRREARMGC